MNFLICFRYLSPYDPDNEIVYETETSNTTKMINNFIAGLFEPLSQFDSLDHFIDVTINSIKKGITSFVNETLFYHNNENTYDEYLYLDEIVGVYINKNKIYPDIQSNINRYEIKQIAQSFVNKYNEDAIKNNEPLFNNGSLYLIFLDIIPKNEETFIVFPGSY